MKVVGYARVSTAEQASEGISLEMQGKKIEAYCSVKDWTADEVISDAGQSAKSLTRPGMQRLLAMVESQHRDRLQAGPPHSERGRP